MTSSQTQRAGLTPGAGWSLLSVPGLGGGCGWLGSTCPLTFESSASWLAPSKCFSDQTLSLIPRVRAAGLSSPRAEHTANDT